MVPSALFSMNRCEGELRKGLQGSKLERIKREEEERRGNEAEALPNRDCYQSLRRYSFGVFRMPVD